MIVRPTLFAALLAAASFANAGTVGTTATVQPAWSGMTGAAAPVSASHASSGVGGSWSSNVRRGDLSSHATMVFSAFGPSAAPAAAAAPAVAAPAAFTFAESAPAPAAAAPAAAAPAAFTFAESAPAPAAAIVAPAPTEMAQTVVAADIIVSADAPVALAAVPEPATGMLMLAGLLGAGFMSRRRK